MSSEPSNGFRVNIIIFTLSNIIIFYSGVYYFAVRWKEGPRDSEATAEIPGEVYFSQ